MNEPNVNPETGIRHGVISGNSVPELLDEIICEGENLDYNSARDELESSLKNVCEEYGSTSDLDFDDLIDATLEDWECDEATYHLVDGEYEYLAQTLGGAYLVRVIKSPWIAYANLCSPCVPNAGNLDQLRTEEDGYACYSLDPTEYPPREGSELRAFKEIE